MNDQPRERAAGRAAPACSTFLLCRTITVEEFVEVREPSAAAAKREADNWVGKYRGRERKTRWHVMRSNAAGQIPPASGGNLDRLVGHSV